MMLGNGDDASGPSEMCFVGVACGSLAEGPKEKLSTRHLDIFRNIPPWEHVLVRHSSNSKHGVTETVVFLKLHRIQLIHFQSLPEAGNKSLMMNNLKPKSRASLLLSNIT